MAATSPGHDSGQPGYTWGDLIAALVAEHGTLAAVAWKLVEHIDDATDDVASIERALRRLRGRDQRDGGVWGQRVLRVFGVPAEAEARVRWMGFYHSPFNDLPLPLCIDQVRLWDRPPVSATRTRLWLHLGHASCALRRRAYDDAAGHAARATSATAGLPPAYDAARIEIALIDGYIASQIGGVGDVDAALGRAERALAGAALDGGDAACFRARLVDQRAYQLNKRGDHAAAATLYDGLPNADVHPFASYRRDAGRAFGLSRGGRIADALVMAGRACEHAGDGGYTRLRAMGLLMIAKIRGRDASAAEIARARGIAERLADAELIERVARVDRD